MKKEEQKQKDRQRRKFPFITLVLAGSTAFIHYFWNNWNFERAKRNFVFSEMNMLNGNPQSALFYPISFEIPFYFVANIPGLLLSGFYIEKYFGSKILIGLFLANWWVSAITTAINHRRIGFAEVRRRGRMSNHNGNITLFLSSVLVGWNPNKIIYPGKRSLTTIYFYYIWIAYLIIYFTSVVSKDPKLRVRNYNETHVAGTLFGLALGILMKRRFI